MLLAGRPTAESYRWTTSEALRVLGARVFNPDRVSHLTGAGIICPSWTKHGHAETRTKLREAEITEAVYLFWRGRQCQYIGMSTKLIPRLNFHAGGHDPKYTSTVLHVDTTLMVFESVIPEWDELELIHDLAPRWNRETQRLPRNKAGRVKGHPYLKPPDGIVLAQAIDIRK